VLHIAAIAGRTELDLDLPAVVTDALAAAAKACRVYGNAKATMDRVTSVLFLEGSTKLDTESPEEDTLITTTPDIAAFIAACGAAQLGENAFYDANSDLV
jgi:hypothetical protein